VRQVPANVSPVYEIRQDTFRLVQVDGHAQPPKDARHVVQRNLVLLEDQVHPLEQVPVADGLAFFQQKVGPLPLCAEGSGEKHRSEQLIECLIELSSSVTTESRTKVYHIDRSRAISNDRNLPNEQVLELKQCVVKFPQIALSYPVNDRYVLVQLVLFEHLLSILLFVAVVVVVVDSRIGIRQARGVSGKIMFHRIIFILCKKHLRAALGRRPRYSLTGTR